MSSGTNEQEIQLCADDLLSQDNGAERAAAAYCIDEVIREGVESWKSHLKNTDVIDCVDNTLGQTDKEVAAAKSICIDMISYEKNHAKHENLPPNLTKAFHENAANQSELDSNISQVKFEMGTAKNSQPESTVDLIKTLASKVFGG